MQKLANMRHWPERMSPNFGMSSRPNNMNMTALNAHQKNGAPGAPPLSPSPAADTTIHYAFNVPFASELAGPNTEEILHATGDSIMRWTHPKEAPDDIPIYELPVHAQNVAALRNMCVELTKGPLPIEAHVISTTPKHLKGQVTTVCLSGAPELVHKSRETILNETPLALRCTTVDVEYNLIVDSKAGVLVKHVTDALDTFAQFCGVDIFILGPKLTPMVDGLNGDIEVIRDQRWRVAIYGDTESTEHAKTQVLIFIDKLLGRHLDMVRFESTLHPIVCGRSRKNIKLIESMTNTAIYFPPFAQMHRYCPPNATRRNPEEIYITGESRPSIELAKRKIHELVSRTKIFMKDAVASPSKIDTVLLGRMDKVRKIMENNGTYIMFPPLASQRNMIRVQGVEGLQIERTMKEIMSLAGQFYYASWWIQQAGASQLPSPHDIRTMLGDICANSDADISFDKMTFTVTGNDDAVKAGLMVLSPMKFVNQTQHQIRVKIELANEHKEFVSGKKNGKINKIMTQSNVQIIFDSFREYNFDIDVIAPTYDSMKQGLGLVEQEMPASISFHVPDQYHKRIIGIGGQHIQRIMKKHSVFVKFSNAMDRGGMGREDDDVKVDNVICRTPARNAQNLELVKSEILDMVDRAHSEFTSQVVHVDRLYHRQLIARLAEIEELEKKWNCKIVFPSTEQASDEVTVTGPEWQVPLCADEFLGMVPETHELVLTRTPSLIKYLESPTFVNDLVAKLKKHYEVTLEVHENPEEKTDDGGRTMTLLWKLTRNNAGGLRDAIDLLHAEFTTAEVETTVVKGALPRPKSDSFEDSLQYFDSKLLQHAPASIGTDSPTKPAFGEEVSQRSTTLFDKLRKPSQLLSSLDRRKNSSHSVNTLFKGSSNVSKSSLISIESTRSFNADRNPWNDSGVNLPDDDGNIWGNRHFGNGYDNKLTPNSILHGGGDVTPRHGTRASGDSGRPSTSHSTNSGYPGPIGPYR
ncbi:KH domain-containing protein [Pseudomassariella vexata]|uniref:KH domain-containing protein n=1 Tax=Pseudomassariella vexata TaxID=1141098 RepID=A0A1Y2DV42_9PEZI|nr:KH domain-containing protein [Pseudomassariella vexata]ORY63141.1 KH domain-containing protein [Pseudomassariella vexata]